MQQMRWTLWVAVVLLDFLSPLAGQSIDGVAQAELRGLRAGHVLGVVFRGELDYLEAFGRTDLEGEVPLTIDHPFPFPALTEVMVGVVAQALADAGVVNLEAPLSAYLPLLSPRLARVSLNQLLTHSAGLDDAALGDGQSWEDALNRLDDRAMFTQPGMIYSPSRYSYPLVVRVLEKVVGQPFPELAHKAILEPLGMTRSTFDLEEAKANGLVQGIGRNDEASSPFRAVEPEARADGLPVLFTTARDLLSFLVVWMKGSVRGTAPWMGYQAEPPGALPGDRGFRSGVYLDQHLGQLRAYRSESGSGYGAAFYLFPRENSAVLSWGVGTRSTRTANLAMERVVGAFSPPDPDPQAAREEALNRTVETILNPGRDPDPASQEPPASLDQLIPHHPGGWGGTYLNGEYKVELRERDGALFYFSGEEEWATGATSAGSIRAQREDGRAAVVFRLMLGAQGRRYLVMGSKAFLNLEDVDW